MKIRLLIFLVVFITVITNAKEFGAAAKDNPMTDGSILQRQEPMQDENLNTL